ncbi:MAG: sugar phosphate isomerase/epimerase family protein [Planctomycetaceae bacterium]
MPEHACRDDEIRISGLQLPEDATTGIPAAPHALAVCQTTTYRWSLADDLARYARAGIGGIGLYRPKVDEVEEEVAIDLVRSSGLNVSSLSWIGGFTGCDGSRQADAVFDAAETVRLASAVGAGTVAVVSGGVGQHILKHARRLLVDSLRLACDHAAELDVRLALHPFSAAQSRNRTVLTNLDETLAAITATGRSNLGLIFDLAELGREPNLLERIPDVMRYVHVVRLSDRRHRPIGVRQECDSPPAVSAVVRAFVDAGYDGPFEFDLWSDYDRPSTDYEALLVSIRSRFDAYGIDVDVDE